ncbi:hypothetical protein LTR91_005770 [Friedmanniomyces endolithicus]|uniref:BTB domain-containing protein n=1 Tax=Friedmanniomyces endolithicus TaxID=329885 RepID=A0A4U0V2M1_9PEZI|nr:hypothetical protein LTS09_007238 [Friedmanniomyces endolithicus]KAK0274725.1 hypothetical protein LTR35_011508 [Friedmanniomyces endolithicus]KAK0288387.1 hypothetical protein LTS00_009597 [Friedmanniomyces endolithicus]KAK0307961.1 hypothetical protein LTR01_005294 [Friedmanniomyces endolithicus]KAK0317890.1 hypothetical protein LTR82_011151 [Friedmanniomyces endolithicus]
MAEPTDFASDSSEDISEERAVEEEKDLLATQARMNSLSYTQTIEVIVGEAKTRFFVHPSVIASKSPFFDAALTRWKSAGQPITLADDEPTLFDAYLASLYAGNIKPRWDLVEDQGVEVRRLYKLYTLTDKLGDLTSANMVIDRIQRYMWRGSPNLEDAIPAWLSTPTESPLRRLIADTFALKTLPRPLTEQLKEVEVPQDLAVLIAFRLACRVDILEEPRASKAKYADRADRALVASEKKDSDKCLYHQHAGLHPKCE